MARALALLLLCAQSRADELLEDLLVARPVAAQCLATQYFSSVLLECVECSAAAADETTAAALVLVGTDFDELGNARRCGCAPRYAETDASATCRGRRPKSRRLGGDEARSR